MLVQGRKKEYYKTVDDKKVIEFSSTVNFILVNCEGR